MRPDRRRGRPLPWGLALLALAYLAGTFGDALHWLTTAHRLCEVHGRVEHVGDEGLAAHHEADPVPSGPIVRADAGEHEGCGLEAFASETVVPFDLHGDEALPLAPSNGRACAPRSVVPGEPRFALAPSRSPPEA